MPPNTLGIEMWLINTRTLELKEFYGQQIPSYAILSHRWTADEVSFKDFRNGRRKDSFGYRKVVEFCKKARFGAGVAWAWADTACIEKRSSAELSEAINSMFRWYQLAQVCLVHLHDVEDPSSESLKLRLGRSDWFTRGWTLQELLAPEHVLFFSSTWKHLGSLREIPSNIYNNDSRSSPILAKDVSNLTHIPVSALTGEESLKLFSVAEKMKWLSSRETTRIEDMAYCAIGLFGIYMPLLYGEGSRAFQRVQELIITRLGDESIFFWGEGQKIGSRGSILASEAADFKREGREFRQRTYRVDLYWRPPSSISSQGLKVNLPKHSALTTAQEQRHMDTLFVPLNCFSSTFFDGLIHCFVTLEKRPCGHYDRVMTAGSGSVVDEHHRYALMVRLAQEAKTKDDIASIRDHTKDLGVRLISERRKIYVHASSEQDGECRSTMPLDPVPGLPSIGKKAAVSRETLKADSLQRRKRKELRREQLRVDSEKKTDIERGTHPASSANPHGDWPSKECHAGSPRQQSAYMRESTDFHNPSDAHLYLEKLYDADEVTSCTVHRTTRMSETPAFYGP